MALDRPKSSMAYHVDQLVEVGFLHVVRTRKVRAIEEFWKRVADLADEFSTLERSVDTVYGFVAAIYPTGHPTLPAP